MRLDDFKYVSEVAKHHNFSNAAKSLFISQPALSKAIMKLEGELGVELFKRCHASVDLTPAGHVFLEQAHAILDMTYELEQKMMAFSSAKEMTLRIGSSQFYIKYFFPHVIPYFNKLYPNINIKITEDVSDQTEKYLLNSDLDLVIVPLPIRSPKIEYAVVYEENFQFAFSNSNERQKNLFNAAVQGSCFDLSVFQEEPFILLKHGFKMRNLSESLCEGYGFHPKVVFETENYDTINSLISNNYGVSFFPSFITKYENVQYVPLDCEGSRREIVAAFTKSNMNNKVIQDFIHCLKMVLDENL